MGEMTIAQLKKTLPSPVREALFSAYGTEVNRRLAGDFGVPITKLRQFVGIIVRLYSKELKLADLQKEVQAVLGMNAQRAKEFAREIAGRRLLVAKDWIGDVEGYIRKLGGNPADYQRFVVDHRAAITREQQELEQETREVVAPAAVTPPPAPSVEPLPVVTVEMQRQRLMEVFREGLHDLLWLQDANDILEVLNDTIGEVIENSLAKGDLERTLIGNQEKLTDKPFLLDGKPVRPTVAAWLSDYLKQHGSGFENFGTLAMSQYVSDSVNTRPLSPVERRAVLKLLQLYRNLKFFPDSMADRDPAEWEIVPLDRVRVGTEHRQPLATPAESNNRPLPPPSSPEEAMQRLEQQYREYRSRRQPVLDAEDQLLVKTRGDEHRVKHELAAAVRDASKYRVIACLKMLAREGTLQTALRDNPSWFASVAEYLHQKYAGKYMPATVDSAVANLRTEPGSVPAVSEFLQFVLRERLKMPEGDSALVGVEIGQLVGEPYVSMAYGNQETGTFQWVENTIGSGRLQASIG